MNSFTYCIIILLILSVLNNLVFYYSVYDSSYLPKDPLLPDNIGVYKYTFYYNINAEEYDNQTYDGIEIKNSFDTVVNNFVNDNIGKCLIIDRKPNVDDYSKIQGISDI